MELLEMFDPQRRHRITPQIMGQELDTAGFLRAQGTTAVRISAARQSSRHILWVIRGDGESIKFIKKAGELYRQERERYHAKTSAVQR